MEVKAAAKFIRVAPRKARWVVDVVRGMDVQIAINQLSNMPQKAARPVLKLINSAVANAEHNFDIKKENLYIKKLVVDMGPVLHRWMPKAFGRATPLRKPMSHISVILDEKVPSNKTATLPKKKVSAAEMTVSLNSSVTENVRANESAAVKEEPTPISDDGKQAKSPEIVDQRMQGKHRHAEHQDKKNIKDKGFLKQVFRRKSGE